MIYESDVYLDTTHVHDHAQRHWVHTVSLMVASRETWESWDYETFSGSGALVEVFLNAEGDWRPEPRRETYSTPRIYPKLKSLEISSFECSVTQ